MHKIILTCTGASGMLLAKNSRFVPIAPGQIAKAIFCSQRMART